MFIKFFMFFVLISQVCFAEKILEPFSGDLSPSFDEIKIYYAQPMDSSLSKESVLLMYASQDTARTEAMWAEHKFSQEEVTHTEAERITKNVDTLTNLIPYMVLFMLAGLIITLLLSKTKLISSKKSNLDNEEDIQ